MLIYAVADIHGKKERFEAIFRNVEKHRPDALVVAGDICARFGQDPEKDAEDLDRLGLPVLMVLGNAEPPSYSDIFSAKPNISVTHLSALNIGETTFVGASGAFSIPFSTRLAWRQESLLQRLSALLSPGCVLISHVPPYGACDKVLGRFSAGCKALSFLVEKTKPAAVICGHIHESPGAGMLGHTLVVNCTMGKSSGALIRLEGGKVKAEML